MKPENSQKNHQEHRYFIPKAKQIIKIDISDALEQKKRSKKRFYLYIDIFTKTGDKNYTFIFTKITFILVAVIWRTKQKHDKNLYLIKFRL